MRLLPSFSPLTAVFLSLTPALFAGAGVRWSGAHEALTELAHDLKAPVFLNSLGRGCLSPDHPYFFSAARRFALGKSDLVLALGVDWDFRLGFGQNSPAGSTRINWRGVIVARTCW